METGFSIVAINTNRRRRQEKKGWHRRLVLKDQDIRIRIRRSITI